MPYKGLKNPKVATVTIEGEKFEVFDSIEVGDVLASPGDKYLAVTSEAAKESLLEGKQPKGSKLRDTPVFDPSHGDAFHGEVA